MEKVSELRDYFESNKGIGVLATADSRGRVDAALYARPHIMEDGKAAFIMTDSRSYRNVSSNPKAAYLFVEKAAGYQGKRLYLTKVAQQSDMQKINEMRRSSHKHTGEDKGKHIVYFQIDEVRALVGD